LEFGDGVGCVWALYEMSWAEIGGENRLGPVGGIGAVPSARVVVVAVDVWATWFSRDEETDG
jgi:hypothetical protein